MKTAWKISWPIRGYWLGVSRMRISALVLVGIFGLFGFIFLDAQSVMLQPRRVFATVETEPVPSRGDAADDIAIWVHPTDSAQSVIIGTDKKKGLILYDLAGATLQTVLDGKINNVDLRYNFPLGDERVDLVLGGNRSKNRILAYRMDPESRRLRPLPGKGIRPKTRIYGLCMYRSAASGKYYVFVTSKAGIVEQWELQGDPEEGITGTRVRTLRVSSAAEGCVADDDYDVLYVAEENRGIWKFSAEPDGGDAATLVDRTGRLGRLTPDVEGLTIYYGRGGRGYLIASSQGSNEFVIYRRRGGNSYVGTFVIASGNGIDKVSHTDGIDVTNVPLGQDFPSGLFVAQDDANDEGNQNFKLVPWENIAEAMRPPLAVDRLPDPRDGAAGRTNVTIPDEGQVFLPVITVSRPPASRGYLTTPGELATIRAKAAQGMEPYASAVADVLEWADRGWNYRLKSTVKCKGADSPGWIDDEKGIPRLYAKALAYHLTGDTAYAAEVKEILQRIMTEVETISLDSQQCQLNFGWGTPELVASADLIEAYWYDDTCTGPLSTQYSDTTLGEGNCKRLFQNWLVKNPYYVVSLAAERTQSNWGAAATTALAYVADYLWDRPDVLLVRRNPRQVNDGQDVAETPGEAYAHANQLALDRMNGYRVSYVSASCDTLDGDYQSPDYPPVKSQITEKGIIPEDARREEFCNIPRYNGEYQNYPEIHLANNIQQCELMLRRGDSSCFDNVDNTDIPEYTYVDASGDTQVTHLYPGRGSIERAIKAIIVDAGTEWRRTSALEVAYRYYYHNATLPGFDQWAAWLSRPGRCRQDICFGTLTHGFAEGETPDPPPTVPAP